MLINQIKSRFGRQANYIRGTSAGTQATTHLNLSIACHRPEQCMNYPGPCDHIFFYEHTLEKSSQSCKPRQSEVVSVPIDLSAFRQTL